MHNIKWCFLALLLFVFTHPANSVTTIGGLVYDGNGGPLTEGTYSLTSSINVPRGETLTIQSGVIAKVFGYRIDVGGELNIQGEANNPVIFTSRDDDTVGELIGDSDSRPSAGDWRGIIFETGSSGTIEHSIFRYGGGSNNPAIKIQDNITLSNCEFSNNQSDGIMILNKTVPAVIQDCSFLNNGGYAVNLEHPNSLVLTDFQNNTAQENNADVIQATGTITVAGTISPDLPVFFENDLIIGDNDPDTTAITVNADSGVIFKSNGSSIFVNDRFNVNGTQDSPVIFTSEQDTNTDAGGDTMAGENIPSAGQWKQVYYLKGSSGEVNHAVIRYCGDNVSALRIANAITVANCEISHNAASGLSISNATEEAAVRNCVFQNNARYAIHLTHPNSLVLTEFQDNSAQNNNLDVISVTGTITKSGDINTSLPIYFDQELSIGDTDENTEEVIVNVSPGVVFKSNGSNIVVNDRFNVDGIATSPILFTSYEDQNGDAGGDTTADSNTPAPGQWQQLLYAAGSSGYISDAVFRYGGMGGEAVLELQSQVRVAECEFSNNNGAGIEAQTTVFLERINSHDNAIGLQLTGNGSSEIDEAIISNNNLNGFNIKNQHSVTALKLTISNNGQDGVEVSTNGDVSVTQSNILNNAVWGVEMRVAQVADFQQNYWGDPTGPRDDNTGVFFINDQLNLYNPDSDGDPMTDFVNWANPNSQVLATPTPSPTSTPSPTPTPSPTLTPTVTPTSTFTPAPTPVPPMTSTPTPTFTPTTPPAATPITEEGVFVLDNTTDVSGDLTGQTDFDPVDKRNLSIFWNASQTNATDWHVYVREGLSGTKFLGRTGSGTVTRFDWYPDAPNLADEFSNGPDFNSIYTFRVIRLDDELTPDDFYETTAPVGFNLEGGNPVTLTQPDMPDVDPNVIAICDDIFGINNLAPTGSSGTDTDQSDWNAIQIAWNFDVNASTVNEYHVSVSLDGGLTYQFLGQTQSGNLNYFWWTSKNEFRTADEFSDGPQDGNEYQFKVTLIPLTGERLSLTSGLLTYQIADEN